LPYEHHLVVEQLQIVLGSAMRVWRSAGPAKIEEQSSLLVCVSALGMAVQVDSAANVSDR